MTGKRSRRSNAARAADTAPEATPGASFNGSGREAAPTAGLATAAETGAAAGPGANVEVLSGAPGGTTFVPDDAVVRRTKDGWRVGSDDLPDLTCAMILADLLAAENGMPEAPGGKPTVQPTAASEAGRLRTTVGQLEHALVTRIRVEQAIGVLAERHRIKPRQAFEQLRDAARSRGRRVIDIAGDVVNSATNPLLQLPDELSRPRSGPRRGARPSGAQ
jgi:hypothetical protein